MKRRRVRLGKRKALTHVRIPCPRPVRVHEPTPRQVQRATGLQWEEEAQEPAAD